MKTTLWIPIALLLGLVLGFPILLSSFDPAGSRLVSSR